HRTLPVLGFSLPAQYNALSTVLIVGLEHQLLAPLQDKGHKVHLLAPMLRSALLHPPRPRDVGAYGLLFDGREQLCIALVAQYSKTGLLVQDLAAPRVDHADRALAHGTHHRRVHSSTRNKF